MRLILTPILLALVLVVGCTSEKDSWPDRAGPKVVTSFAPLASIAMSVAGDHAVVRSVLSQQGPHSSDVKLSEPRMLVRADLFFINGLGLDNHIAKKMLTASNKSLKPIELGTKLNPATLLEGGACDHEDGHDHAGHDHGDGTDAHVWLGLKHALTFARTVRDELSTIDPAHAANYANRTKDFETRIAELEAHGKLLIAHKTERKFLPFHGSMAYFAETFDLKMIDPIQTKAGQEPTPKKLEEIIQTCQKQKVRVIAVEPQFSAQSSAKRILEELKRRGMTDVVMVELDPMETCNPDELSGTWYESKMRANIEALAKVLR
jgi:zinc transport system substrate-binding protein